jgi:hypothetical protein
VQEPTFFSWWKKIAYAKENNLFVWCNHNTSTPTRDGKTVINGITDWVYEEEFAFVAFDGVLIARKYIRFDESQVPEFSMSIKTCILQCKHLNILQRVKRTQYRCMFMMSECSENINLEITMILHRQIKMDETIRYQLKFWIVTKII